MRTWQIDRRTGILALALGGVLLASNLALLRQNAELKSRAAAGLPRSLAPGDTVPPLRGIGMAGEDLAVRYGDGEAERTLLLVFSPLCSWCTRNMASWEAIARAVEGEGVRIVAVSTTRAEVAEYAAQHPLLQRVPVIAEVDARDQRAYGLQGTPQTLVVGGDGVVEKVWLGAFHGEQQAEAERFFDTELPGVVMAPASGARGDDRAAGAGEIVSMLSASTGRAAPPRGR